MIAKAILATVVMTLFCAAQSERKDSFHEKCVSKMHIQSVDHTAGAACKECNKRIDVCYTLCTDCARKLGKCICGEIAQKKIEVCFVFDTTGSMSGLIEGAKKKIWAIVNSTSSAKPSPRISVGFVIYRDRGDEYVTKVFDLTEDIDQCFKDLSTFSAGGGGDGPEDVNQALDAVQSKIKWSAEKDTYKVLFLVGDAPPHNDYKDVPGYKETLEKLVKKDIVVNTIQCGKLAETTPTWQEIARLGEGEYFQIDQSGGMVAVATPFDKELTDLAKKFEDTIVPLAGRARKVSELKDGTLRAEATGAASEKAGFYGKNKQLFEEFDIVQQLEDSKLDIEKLKSEDLPEELRKLSREELKKYIEDKRIERENVRKQILEKEKQRQEYINSELKKSGNGDSFDLKVLDCIKKQGSKKGLEY